MKRRLPAVSWLVAALLMVGAGYAAEQARSYKSERAESDVVYLPSTEALRLVSLGYEELTADLLWLRIVTYYGEWKQGDHGMNFFRELAYRVVELDPHFVDAYRFAALVLADDLGAMDEAIALLEKGMVEMPDSWWLPFEAGFLEYTVGMNDEAASRWFEVSARKPDAPDVAKRFAAFVASRAGDLKVSYELWRFVAETTHNPDMRKKALEYMGELQAAIEGTGPVPDWARRPRAVNGRVDDDV